MYDVFHLLLKETAAGSLIILGGIGSGMLHVWNINMCAILIIIGGYWGICKYFNTMEHIGVSINEGTPKWMVHSTKENPI